MEDFFISYNKADKVWASGLANWLDQAMFTTILQEQDFVAGSNFVSEMHHALKAAKRLIMVLSPDYLTAKFPEAEWTAAFASDPTMLIPVRVRECQPDGLLKPIIYIDLTNLPVAQAREKFISEITAALNGKRKRRVGNPIPSPQRSPASVKQTIIGDKNVVAGGDMIHTEKIVRKNVTQPGPQHITEEQAYEVKLLIDELSQIDVDAGRPDSHRSWFSWLYRKFKVTSYKTIPAEKFEPVISWLRQQKAINRKKLRRPANALWRDQLYGAIYGRWRQLGFQKDAIYDFAFQRLELDKPIGSLKELGEQNLQKLYGIVIRIQPNQ
jgi:TIR domain